MWAMERAHGGRGGAKAGDAADPLRSVAANALQVAERHARVLAQYLADAEQLQADANSSELFKVALAALKVLATI